MGTPAANMPISEQQLERTLQDMRSGKLGCGALEAEVRYDFSKEIVSLRLPEQTLRISLANLRRVLETRNAETEAAVIGVLCEIATTPARFAAVLFKK